MKLLITGATGLIGSEILKLSLRKEYKVHYLTTSPDKIKNTPHLKGFYWNPGTGEIDMNCFEGIDGIINLAGATIVKRWTTAYKKEIVQSRIDALALLRKALGKLKEHSISSIVTASAIGIYPHSFTTLYQEDDLTPDTSFLGHAVVQWENAADHLETYHIPLAKIRVGMVLSASGGALPPMVKSVRYGVGASFGSGLQWQSWIHCHDIARIFLFAVENRLEGIYNGVAPNPVTQNKLMKEIASQLKRPLILPRIPPGILKLVLGEMAVMLYTGQRVSAKKLLQEGFTFNFRSIHSALKDLL